MQHDVPIDWLPVDPIALLQPVYRCRECGCLVADVDRDRHAEHHAAAAA